MLNVVGANLRASMNTFLVTDIVLKNKLGRLYLSSFLFVTKAGAYPSVPTIILEVLLANTSIALTGTNTLAYSSGVK
jgi:hypothetical protein